MKSHIERIDEVDRLLRRMQRVDSFIRNGQFISANREVRNIISDCSDDNLDLLFYLKRISGFLAPVVNAYGETVRVMDILKKDRKSIIASALESDDGNNE